jgi:hypothetical protein
VSRSVPTRLEEDEVARLQPGGIDVRKVRPLGAQGAAVQSVLAATADPEAPNEVDVSQPSAALTARADAQGALNSLFLGLSPTEALRTV